MFRFAVNRLPFTVVRQRANAGLKPENSKTLNGAGFFEERR